MKLLTIFEVAI